MIKKLAFIVGIAITLLFIGGIVYFLFLAPDDGGSIRIPSIPDGVFNVFGGGDNGTPIRVGAQPDENTTVGAIESPAGLSRLRQVAIEPVAGAVIFEREGILYIRYVERETGHIYEVPSGAMEKTRISNTTIPRVQKAVFNADGTRVVLQYLDDSFSASDSFVAAVTPTAEGGSLTGVFLPKNSSNVFFVGDDLFYTTSSSQGTEGFLLTKGSKEATRIFSIPLREVAVMRAGGKYIAQTRGNGTTAGYVYDIAGGGLGTRRFAGIIGLSVRFNAKDTASLFSTGGSGTMSLSAKTATTSGEVLLSTLADKCVFANTNEATAYCAAPTQTPAGLYPDAWYQGIASFSDNIWLVDARNRLSNMLISPKENSGREIDAQNLQISPHDESLIFLNKGDQTLWELDVRS